MTDSTDRPTTPGRASPWELSVGPDPEHWDHWEELDPKAWPRRDTIAYRCVPTICFNCESACGLLAFVDKKTGEIRKFEGNPVHPGSRGRTCAKGPATINQVQDDERILYPLRRIGPRGSGKFQRVSWEDALTDIAGRIRRALDEDRHNEVVYHVGRPGEDHFVNRMLQIWGVDGHNSHTNVCSAAARTGFALWMGSDRPSPDFANAKFILLLSAHLETGHYFNPHAQRIIEGKRDGAKIAVVDTRLSNTSTHADHWVSTWPGTEAALLLGVARELLSRDAIDRAFVERWTNWADYLRHIAPDKPPVFDDFLAHLRKLYDGYTDAFVADECKIPPGTVAKLADDIAAAGSRFASHLWRNTAAGNLGGWQVARCLTLLHVLTGSLGTRGGFNPNSWDKFSPAPPAKPKPQKQWNELLWPREYPLAHFEMSFLLPHLMREQKRKIDVYFTRVYNPVWTNPDGCSWIDMLEREDAIGLHVALTPTWSETAQWADYVLPMGLGPERHDLMSQETHAGTWIGFRQPVLREYQRRERGREGGTLGTNPGEVWEEAEFWIDLSCRIDDDGSRGIRSFFASKQDPSRPMSIDEYFADVFDHSVPGLPERAREQGLTPLEYMRRHGAYEVPYAGQERYAKPAAPGQGDDRGAVGFPTPSKKLEFYSPTLDEWGFGEHAVPGYIRSHVHWSELDQDAGMRVLLPTFRLPTLIHTRSANAKWLQEISHTNPLWVHPSDAEKLGVKNGELARVRTRIGHFVLRAWVTEGIHPGIVACSHHVGRWRLHDDVGGHKMGSARVGLSRDGDTFSFRQGPEQSRRRVSQDADTDRVWWQEIGVNQNLTFPVQPDPISGMHCWHQVVWVSPAAPDDHYGDVFVDMAKAREQFEQWLRKTKPAPGPGGLRRPLWLKRPLKPDESCYYIKEE